MALRPVYIPGGTSKSLVIPIEIEFQWFPGFSISQKQKSIAALHAATAKRNITRVLEISSKSPAQLGGGVERIQFTVSNAGCTLHQC